MKIVITGSSGFIGSHLKNSLKEHDIIEWDIKLGKDIKIGWNSDDARALDPK